MTTLRMKGERCASLEEFRKNFDFTNARDYLREGRLSRWVRELGENDLADELDELKVADYCDQTLLDNFVGIFGLTEEQACLPEPPGEPGVTVAQSVIMRNVEGNSPAAIHRYMDNKMVLKFIRELVLNELPEGLPEKIEITADSRFVGDLGLDKDRLGLLADRLNDKFAFVMSDSDSRFSPAVDGILYRNFDSKTVGELLDKIKTYSLRLKSYTGNEAKQLWEDGF